MIIRELVTLLRFDYDTATVGKFMNDMGAAKDLATQAASKFNAFGDAAIKAGKKLSLYVTAPIVGLGTIAVSKAIAAEETVSKFGVVFENVARSAERSTEHLRKAYGLGRTESKRLLADTGDLLVGFGFSEQAALDMSTEVQKLAVDLASFTNIEGGATRASAALTRALLGEREMAKMLGIAILEEDVKKQVAINTTAGLRFESERQAKAYATLQLAQKQSTKAIGDYARTSQSTANRMRLFRVRFEDLLISVGSFLIFALKINTLLGKMAELFERAGEWWGRLGRTWRTVITVAFLLLAALGPLLIILGTLAKLVGTLIFLKTMLALVGFGSVIPMFAAWFAAALPIILLLGAIGAALWLVIDDFNKWTEGQDSMLGILLGDWQEWVESILSFIDMLSNAWERFITKWLDFDIKAIVDDMKFLAKTAGFFFKDLFGMEEPGVAASAPALVAPGAGASSKVLTVKSTVNTNVPEGTPESQVQAVRQNAKQAVEEAWSDIISQADSATAIVE